MSTKNQNSKDIIIAVIGVVGVLGGALLANWDKVFQKAASTPPVIPSISPAPSNSPTISPQESAKPSPSETLIKLEPLKRSLSDKNWVEADLATDLLRPKSLSCSDLSAINKLWLDCSNNNFGYSVQRKIWEQRNLKGKYDEFAEFISWKRDDRYAFNIHDPILNTSLDSPAQSPLGHLPFNGWQVRGAVREDFDAFMLKLAQCKI
jgi:GUN4-like